MSPVGAERQTRLGPKLIVRTALQVFAIGPNRSSITPWPIPSMRFGHGGGMLLQNGSDKSCVASPRSLLPDLLRRVGMEEISRCSCIRSEPLQ